MILFVFPDCKTFRRPWYILTRESRLLKLKTSLELWKWTLQFVQVYYTFFMIKTNFHLKIKFMFSKKATKIEKNLHRQFDTYLVNVKSTVKIWSIFVAFLDNMNFK